MNLTRLTALEARRLLINKEVSPIEMVNAAFERISETDQELNAIPTLCIDRALKKAKEIMDASQKSKKDSNWLGGLPIVVKDLNDVAEVKTTYGSTLFKENIPKASDIMVKRLEANGAIVIGKSNTPEFGHGAKFVTFQV